MNHNLLDLRDEIDDAKHFATGFDGRWYADRLIYLEDARDAVLAFLTAPLFLPGHFEEDRTLAEKNAYRCPWHPEIFDKGQRA